MGDTKVRIWYQTLDDDGKVIDTGVYYKAYCYYGTAANIAHKLYGNKKNIKYKISVLNPFETHTRSTVCDICGKTFDVTVDSWGRDISDVIGITSWSGSIPAQDGRKHFGEYYHTCPDCIRKINNFVDSLKMPTIHIKDIDTCSSCAYMCFSGSECRKYECCFDGCDNYDPKADTLQNCRCQQIPTGEPCPYYKPTV